MMYMQAGAVLAAGSLRAVNHITGGGATWGRGGGELAPHTPHTRAAVCHSSEALCLLVLLHNKHHHHTAGGSCAAVLFGLPVLQA